MQSEFESAEKVNTKEIRHPGQKNLSNKNRGNRGYAQKPAPAKPDPLTGATLADERAKDHEQVRGIFRFHEVPGGVMTFPFRKYKGDEIMSFTMRDGEIYTIPLMVAKHLNKNCWYPVHDYQMDDMGRFANEYRIDKKIRRVSFQSLEFVDTDDITPVGEATIYTAHRIGT